MKNKGILILVGMVLLAGIVLLVLFATNNIVILGIKPNYDYSTASLVKSDSNGATYNVGYNIGGYDPIYKTSPENCGCSCSYDYTIVWHPQTNSASPPFVDGIVQNQWFEGIVTQEPNLRMVIQPNSDISSTHSVNINNTRVYCQVQKNGIYASLICRYTGDIYAIDNKCGSIYGTVTGSGTVTIPTQSYLDSLTQQEQEEEIVTEKEIKDEVTNEDVIDMNPPKDNTDTTQDTTQTTEDKTQDTTKDTTKDTTNTQPPVQKETTEINQKLITWIVSIVLGILLIVVFILILNKPKRK